MPSYHGKRISLRGDYPGDDDDFGLAPEPRELLECLTGEAVSLIEDGESPDTIIFSALECAFNLGCQYAQDSQD